MSGYRFDRLKILVVDDNVHMRKLVVTILQAFGAQQIFEAADGERAWTQLRDANPDVVILDWMMEGMSGLEFVKMVRTLAADTQSLRADHHADRAHPCRSCAPGARCRRQRIPRQAGVGESNPDAPHCRHRTPPAPMCGPDPISVPVADAGMTTNIAGPNGARMSMRPPWTKKNRGHDAQRTADRTFHAAQHAQGQGRRLQSAVSTWPR